MLLKRKQDLKNNASANRPVLARLMSYVGDLTVHLAREFRYLYIAGLIFKGATEALLRKPVEDRLREEERNKTSPIIRAPGFRFLYIAGLIFGKQAKELVFEVWLADFQDEYLDALKNGSEVECCIICIREHLRGLVICATLLLTGLVQLIIKIFKGW